MLAAALAVVSPGNGQMPTVLLLDNRDSFVWNLAQAFLALGAEVDVVRSDAIDSAGIRRRSPGALVLSPGPGRPEDAGVCIDAVRTLSGELPILGICLGHQAIGAAFGARIDRAPPCHGKPWPIHHHGDGLLEGMPQPFVACRYHSLVVDPATLPQCLVGDAYTAEGQLMALHHRQAPTFGLQFHPESFRTARGTELLARFLAELR
jgi:anthranilate synthase/aminodeoxychorismate synthase-like glutamine amidotransferase